MIVNSEHWNGGKSSFVGNTLEGGGVGGVEWRSGGGGGSYRSFGVVIGRFDVM